MYKSENEIISVSAFSELGNLTQLTSLTIDLRLTQNNIFKME